MSAVTANGAVVFSGKLTFPRQGAWVADLVVDNPDGITGACTIVLDGGLALQGTVVRGGPFLQTTRVRVAPGADGLRDTARAQHYRQTKVGTVLGDLLRTAGETLSGTADQATLAVTLTAYTQMALPIGRAISALFGDARAGKSSWRMLPDGTMWVGPEAWADSGLVEPDDYVEMDEAPELAAVDLGVDALFPMPGTVLGTRRVSYSEISIEGGAVRARSMLFEGFFLKRET